LPNSRPVVGETATLRYGGVLGIVRLASPVVGSILCSVAVLQIRSGTRAFRGQRRRQSLWITALGGANPLTFPMNLIGFVLLFLAKEQFDRTDELDGVPDRGRSPGADASARDREHRNARSDIRAGTGPSRSVEHCVVRDWQRRRRPVTAWALGAAGESGQTTDREHRRTPSVPTVSQTFTVDSDSSSV
jgi:hypothetical protein